jgi:hypothetical protein
LIAGGVGGGPGSGRRGGGLGGACGRLGITTSAIARGRFASSSICCQPRLRAAAWAMASRSSGSGTLPTSRRTSAGSGTSGGAV